MAKATDTLKGECEARAEELRADLGRLLEAFGGAPVMDQAAAALELRKLAAAAKRLATRTEKAKAK